MSSTSQDHLYPLLSSSLRALVWRDRICSSQSTEKPMRGWIPPENEKMNLNGEKSTAGDLLSLTGTSSFPMTWSLKAVTWLFKGRHGGLKNANHRNVFVFLPARHPLLPSYLCPTPFSFIFLCMAVLREAGSGNRSQTGIVINTTHNCARTSCTLDITWTVQEKETSCICIFKFVCRQYI